jgi:hypothetical protein
MRATRRGRSPQSLLGGLAADDVHRGAFVDIDIVILHEETAEHAPVVALARGRVSSLSVEGRTRVEGFPRSVA